MELVAGQKAIELIEASGYKLKDWERKDLFRKDGDKDALRAWKRINKKTGEVRWSITAPWLL